MTEIIRYEKTNYNKTKKRLLEVIDEYDILSVENSASEKLMEEKMKAVNKKLSTLEGLEAKSKKIATSSYNDKVKA